VQILNLSAEPLGRLHAWLPHDLHAEKVVFLPDACPGKSPLPTGTAVLLNILPSHMAGDVALVRATARVGESLQALSHGTGRAMSRAESKPLAEAYDFAALRKRVLIPARVQDASLRTDGPFAYRDLDACLGLLEGYVEEIERFAVVGYMGHL
jgi:hypothetical protein